MPKHFSIKDWSEADRPREKLLAKGKGNLTDASSNAIALPIPLLAPVINIHFRKAITTLF